jgi:hypothetical protein
VGTPLDAGSIGQRRERRFLRRRPSTPLDAGRLLRAAVALVDRWACVAVAVVMVSTLAVACGGDDPARLSRSEYTRRANAHCATLEAASAKKRLAQSPSATGATVRRSLHDAADELRKLVAGFDALTPPAALESDANDLVQLLRDYAGGLDRFADDVGAHETLGQASNAHPQQIDRLNGLADRATGLVTRLGLTDCLLPS